VTVTMGATIQRSGVSAERRRNWEKRSAALCRGTATLDAFTLIELILV